MQSKKSQITGLSFTQSSAQGCLLPALCVVHLDLQLFVRPRARLRGGHDLQHGGGGGQRLDVPGLLGGGRPNQARSAEQFFGPKNGDTGSDIKMKCIEMYWNVLKCIMKPNKCLWLLVQLKWESNNLQIFIVAPRVSSCLKFLETLRRFIYVDDREVCYMLLYCSLADTVSSWVGYCTWLYLKKLCPKTRGFACVFNVALDLITTYMVAYRINVGLRMKTYDGTLLENLQQFSDRFESYAMQRTLANNLYAYAFPATWLTCLKLVIVY